MIRNISVFDSYLSKQIYQNNMKLIQFKLGNRDTNCEKKFQILKYQSISEAPLLPLPHLLGRGELTIRSWESKG